MADETDPRIAKHVPLPATSADPCTLGVALSGGGVRASLFALGALLYLVDTGRNQSVREISSVSGGSITNAFVAQRCDFAHVTADDFDEVATDLVGAISAGLLSQNRLIGLLVLGFILTVALAVGTTHWLPADIPLRSLATSALIVGLFGAFGILLLLRGMLVTRRLQRCLFDAKNRPATLAGISSSVMHVFCATDLNSSMPAYLTNRAPHFLSPAWGRPAGEGAALGALPLSDVVRASAAFPVGIPPKRLRIDGAPLMLTPNQMGGRWRELAFRGVEGDPPDVLYLTDGGVWNNLGTDWFDPEERRSCLVPSDFEPDIERLLVVNATAPTAARRHKPIFRTPWLAELALPYRAWMISYGSAVAARLRALARSGVVTDAGLGTNPEACGVRRSDAHEAEPDAPPLVARMITAHAHRQALAAAIATLVSPVEGDLPEATVVWRTGARRRFGSFVPWTWCRSWAVRRPAGLHWWNAGVPTTLGSIPQEIAVQLLVQGYLATGSALAACGLGQVARFPGIARFARLAKLETTWDAEHRLTILGPPLVRSRDSRELTEAMKDDVWLKAAEGLDRMFGNLRAASKLVEEGDRALHQFVKATDSLDRWYEQKQKAQHDAWEAEDAIQRGDFQGARAAFDRARAVISLTDDSLISQDLALYALVLAHLADPQAAAAANDAERVFAMLPADGLADTERECHAFNWLVLSEAYGAMSLSDSSARCLTCAKELDAVRVARWQADLARLGVTSGIGTIRPVELSPVVARALKTHSDSVAAAASDRC